ncbi:uncharacterized protein PgNI_02484 [Pyricularia grisea]|uniref:Uncharacterized protein n=1 Tax=Pyricularia grisea TaxID=148305 RepID=A0A6P8BKQ1_PYRGI|nr:uncharacterized protein PgNI_02484 [Pyricularia grisea]TLD17167.1 hypothetical protein PgNI_02484 [Pyricularia grisea]
MPHAHSSGIVSRFPRVRAGPLALEFMSNPPHTRPEVPLQRSHAQNDIVKKESSPACHAFSIAAALKATYTSANRYAKLTGVVGDGVTFVTAPRCSELAVTVEPDKFHRPSCN